MSARFAQASDFNSIMTLVESLPKHAAFNWPSPQLKEELSQTQVLVYEKDSQILSFVCYRNLPELYEISVLATHAGFQRLSLQSELIKYLQELAAQQQKKIMLEVHHHNQPALALYAKLGFLEVHRRKKYYSDQGDAVIMAWNDKAGCRS